MRLKRHSHKYSFGKRKWKRIRTNGIVALTSSEDPVIFLVYDLAQGGVSFLHAGETEIIIDEFHMDILVFDILTDFECYINQIRGRMIGRQRVADSKSKIPVWLYHVEFFELENATIKLLQTFCDSSDNPHYVSLSPVSPIDVTS